MWGKMEGKLGAGSGVAGCSIDTGSTRHTALKIRDALLQTFVTGSELY